MVYKIDPSADWPFVEEFRRTPIGHHSPNLMRLLNLLRFNPSGSQTVLVAQKPLVSWVLGQIPPGRVKPIHIDRSRIFTNREDAEWAVFCVRWRQHTGIDITTPRNVPLAKDLPC